MVLQADTMYVRNIFISVKLKCPRGVCGHISWLYTIAWLNAQSISILSLVTQNNCEGLSQAFSILFAASAIHPSSWLIAVQRYWLWKLGIFLTVTLFHVYLRRITSWYQMFSFSSPFPVGLSASLVFPY